VSEWPHVRRRQFVQQRSGAGDQRDAVMNRWYDRKFEHVLLVYMFAWAVALLVTYMLSK
jgi:hypothetical protein